MRGNSTRVNRGQIRTRRHPLQQLLALPRKKLLSKRSGSWSEKFRNAHKLTLRSPCVVWRVTDCRYVTYSFTERAIDDRTILGACDKLMSLAD